MQKFQERYIRSLLFSSFMSSFGSSEFGGSPAGAVNMVFNLSHGSAGSTPGRVVNLSKRDPRYIRSITKN